MTNEPLRVIEPQLLDLPDRYGRIIKPGDRVKLTRHHPRTGEIGTYKGVERINATGKWASLVRFEESVDGCYVTKANQWERYDDQ